MRKNQALIEARIEARRRNEERNKMYTEMEKKENEQKIRARRKQVENLVEKNRLVDLEKEKNMISERQIRRKSGEMAFQFRKLAIINNCVQSKKNSESPQKK